MNIFQFPSEEYVGQNKYPNEAEQIRFNEYAARNLGFFFASNSEMEYWAQKMVEAGHFKKITHNIIEKTNWDYMYILSDYTVADYSKYFTIGFLKDVFRLVEFGYGMDFEI